MSDREDAIKKLLDDGDELTEENIKTAMPPKPDTNKEVIDELRNIRAEIKQLRGEVKNQRNQEIKIPEGKAPIVNVPAPVVIQSDRPRRKLNFSFIRDQNGNIISAKAEEE